MTSNAKYIKTEIKTRINVSPKDLSELRSISKSVVAKKFNNLLLDKLAVLYDNKCIRDGHIKEGSIKLLKKSLGEIRSAQFTGDITYQILFQCELYTPRIGEIITPRIMQINEMGLIAQEGFIEVFVVNEGEFVPDNLIMQRLKPGNIIMVEILQYRIENNRVFAIGKLFSKIDDFNREAIFAIPPLVDINIYDVLKGTINPADPLPQDYWVHNVNELDLESDENVQNQKLEQHSRYAFMIYTEKLHINPGKWWPEWRGTQSKPVFDGASEVGANGGITNKVVLSLNNLIPINIDTNTWTLKIHNAENDDVIKKFQYTLESQGQEPNEIATIFADMINADASSQFRADVDQNDILITYNAGAQAEELKGGFIATIVTIPEKDNDDLNKIIDHDFENMKLFSNSYEMVWPNNKFNNHFVNHKINTVLLYGIEDGKENFLPSRPVSRAFFKMWDMMAGFDWVDRYKENPDPINVLSLAEAPGGFIQAIITYRIKTYKGSFIGANSDDKYYAITLKKTPENGISADWNNYLDSNGNIDETLNTFFSNMKYKNGVNVELGYGGKDGNGDLTDVNTINYLRDRYNKYNDKADIITADGDVGADAGKYGSKNKPYDELMNQKLIYGEILSALVSQKHQGTFVLKIKDIYSYVTKQLLQLLRFVYGSVTIVKPRNSRPANSEKYVIAKDFIFGKEIDTDDHLQTYNNLIDNMILVLEKWNEIDKQDENIHIYANRRNFLKQLFNNAIGLDEIDQIATEVQTVFGDNQLKTIYNQYKCLGISDIPEYLVNLNVETNYTNIKPGQLVFGLHGDSTGSQSIEIPEANYTYRELIGLIQSEWLKKTGTHIQLGFTQPPYKLIVTLIDDSNNADTEISITPAELKLAGMSNILGFNTVIEPATELIANNVAQITISQNILSCNGSSITDPKTQKLIKSSMDEAARSWANHYIVDKFVVDPSIVYQLQTKHIPEKILFGYDYLADAEAPQQAKAPASGTGKKAAIKKQIPKKPKTIAK